MDLVTCHCRNTRCAQGGKMGNASALHPQGSDRGEVRLRCTACGDVVSASTGTAYAGIRTDLAQYALGAKLLAEGLGVRATARILEVDKDTVNQWLRRLGPHGAAIMAYHVRHLHLTECQRDEWWTFVKKKEGHLTPLEHLLDLYGDTWVWMAFAPITKVVHAWVAGRRTRQESVRLIQHLQSSTDGSIPFFTSDELPHYAAALLEVYGQTVGPPRPGRPGRPRSAYKVPPEDLLYAVVNKRRQHGRVVAVTTHVVYGTPSTPRTSARCFTRVACDLDVRGGAQQSDHPSARASHGTQSEGIFERPRIPGASLGLVLRLLSFCGTPSRFASTLGTPPAYQRQRLTQAVEAAHPRRGSRCNRPPLDHGRTLELSRATPVCLAIDTKSPTR